MLYFNSWIKDLSCESFGPINTDLIKFFPYILLEVSQTLIINLDEKNVGLPEGHIFNLDFLLPFFKGESFIEYGIINLVYYFFNRIENLTPYFDNCFCVKPLSFLKNNHVCVLKVRITKDPDLNKRKIISYLKNVVEDIKIFLIKSEKILDFQYFFNKNKNVIKSSLHLENQKFGKKPKINEEQLDLFPKIFTQAKEIKIEVIGLNFQSSHYQALGAIQNLLAKTNYNGNAEGTFLTRDTNSFKFEGRIPKIKFSKSQYLEAYGVKKYLTARNKMEFGGKEALIAIEALQYLGTQTHLIIATRKRWQDRVEVVDRYQTLSPILRICEGWEGLTPIENRSLDEGRILESLNIKHRGFVVEPCPLLIDQIDSYFVLKPANIYQEIKLKFPNASRFAYTFIDWIVKEATLKKINNLNSSKLWPEKLEIGLETLSYILRMDRYIKSRNWKKINTSINRCVDIAVALGWLLKHQSVEGKTINKKEIFFLNKEKFNQISSK